LHEVLRLCDTFSHRHGRRRGQCPPHRFGFAAEGPPVCSQWRILSVGAGLAAAADRQPVTQRLRAVCLSVCWSLSWRWLLPAGALELCGFVLTEASGIGALGALRSLTLTRCSLMHASAALPALLAPLAPTLRTLCCERFYDHRLQVCLCVCLSGLPARLAVRAHRVSCWSGWLMCTRFRCFDGCSVRVGSPRCAARARVRRFVA
jgi:hypothetical protein